MKKLFFILIIILILGLGAGKSEAIDSPNIAALDKETFVTVFGSSVYLFKIEDGKIVLKDSVFVYTMQSGLNVTESDIAVMKRLKTILK
jgi:hypothetical protein